MPLYACGWKGFVEIRDASRPPKVLKSRAKYEGLKLEQLCFKGGSHLISLDKRRFASLTKLSVPIGAVILIPARLRAGLEEVRLEQFAPQAPEQTPHPVAAPASFRPNRTARSRRSHEGPGVAR